MSEPLAPVSTHPAAGPELVAARNNRLLEPLPLDELIDLLSAAETVCLTASDRLAQPGLAIARVYFPISGYAALVVAGQEESGVEVAMVGREGMLGWEGGLGVDQFVVDARVPEGMLALSVDAREFRRRLAATRLLRSGVRNYVAQLFRVVARSAHCTGHHRLEARLARCLLEVADRNDDAPINLTQKTLSLLLGVRRSGVTNAATHLQLVGLIQYRRGEIRILDRRGLEDAACDCYRFAVDAY